MSDLPGPRVVELAKIVDYLLNADHPIGRHKAEFFRRFGFDPREPLTLALALDRHAAIRPVAATSPNAFGTKYEVRCHVDSPDGRNPCIVSIWFQPAGCEVCRLITSYPAPQDG